MAVGERTARAFPDIVVVRVPGKWLKMMAEVETADTVNDESALTEWLPYSKVGDLYSTSPSAASPRPSAS
jgi:hypothetical protein